MLTSEKPTNWDEQLNIEELARTLRADRETVLRSAQDFNERAANEQLSRRTLYNYFSGDKLSLRNRKSRDWFVAYLLWASKNFDVDVRELERLAAKEGLETSFFEHQARYDDPGQRFVAKSMATFSHENPYIAETRERVSGVYELFVPSFEHRHDAKEKAIRTWALLLSPHSDLSLVVDDRGREFMGAALFLRDNIVLTLMPRGAGIEGDFLNCAFRTNRHYLSGLLAGMITRTERYSSDIIAFKAVARKISAHTHIDIESTISASGELDEVLHRMGLSIGITSENTENYTDLQNVLYQEKLGLNEDFLYELERIERR